MKSLTIKKEDLPVKIIYEGKEYWIKRATKTDGLYMNNQPERKDNDTNKVRNS